MIASQIINFVQVNYLRPGISDELPTDLTIFLCHCYEIGDSKQDLFYCFKIDKNVISHYLLETLINH